MSIKSAIILCAGNSFRFGEDKLSIKFGDYTLPQYAIKFCIDNNIENIYITLNKNKVTMDHLNKNLYHSIIHDINKVIKENWLSIQFQKEDEDNFNKINDNKKNIFFQFQKEDEYGPAAAIKCWQNIIKEDFIVLFGDNYYKGILPDFNFNKSTAYASYISKQANPRNLQLAVIVDNYIIEKPHAFLEGDFFCGYVAFSKDIMTNKYCNKIQKSIRNEYEITDLFNSVENRNIICNNLKWIDITYKGDIDKVKEYILKNE